MAVLERPFDRGTRLGREAIARIGRELRTARIDRGLTVDAVAAALGVSNAEVSRIERDLSPSVPAIRLFRFAGLVGLDLSTSLFPGAAALRDGAHVSLLAAFARSLPPSLRWGVEVPLPIAGDQRAWDGMVSGTGWRYGVEAETAPHDAQALLRRLALKERDGDVDGLLLLLRDSRRVRDFLRAAGDELAPRFPIRGAAAMARLRNGENPTGSAVIVIATQRSSRAT